MNKKETIEDRVKSLEAREQKIKLKLDNNSDEMKDKAMRVGKIALIAGIVSILGYWLYNIIFQDDEDEEKPKKRRKKRKEVNGFSSRITALAIPYLSRFLDGILDPEDKNGAKSEESKESVSEED